MKCKVISISHKPSSWEKEALQFYLKQLPKHIKISSIDVKPNSSKSMDQSLILDAECNEVLRHINKTEYTILWDRLGKKISSHGFADLIQDKADAGQDINFIIGGALGASDRLFQSSQLVLSASDLTFLTGYLKYFLLNKFIERVLLRIIILIINNDF
jgi:23S rRNA (pseudouridine1915-N3)-methyltransferase